MGDSRSPLLFGAGPNARRMTDMWRSSQSLGTTVCALLALVGFGGCSSCDKGDDATADDAAAEAAAPPPKPEPVDAAAEAGAGPCDAKKSGAWYLQFPVDSTKYLAGAAADGCHNVIVAGTFKSEIDFGGGAGGGLLKPEGGEDIFVAKFSSSAGFVWAKRFGGPKNQTASQMTVDPEGNIYLTGTFDGSVNFDDRTLEKIRAVRSAFYLVRLTPAGKTDFSRLLVDTGAGAHPTGLAASKEGAVALIGVFSRATDLGGGAISNGLGGAFIAKYNQYGAHKWSKSFLPERYPKAIVPRAVAFDPEGNIVFTGSFQKKADFGGKKLTSAGKTDQFVAKLDGDGEHLWSYSFGDADPNAGTGVAIDGSGNIYVLGYDERKPPRGPSWKRNYRATVMMMSPEGKKQWRKTFGFKGSLEDCSIAAGKGDVFLSCGIDDTTSFDKETVEVPKNARRHALVRLDQQGKVQSAEAIEKEYPVPGTVAVDDGGEVIVAGVADPAKSGNAAPRGKPKYYFFLQKR